MYYSKWIIIGLFGLSLFGCQKTDNKSSSQKEGATPLSEIQQDQASLSLNITPTALLLQTLGTSNNQRLGVAFDANDVFSGTMTATRTDVPSTPEPFDWHITIEENFTTQSHKTIVLPPGTYNFELEVERGNQKYRGEVLAIDIADGTNDVPMTLRPMIALTTIDVVVNEVAISQFRFQYDPNELNLANFTTPRIGIIVDSNPELIFALNPDGGSDVLEDAMVGLLPEGPHTIQLKLYDGSIQRGKSIAAQEDQTVTPGTDIRMDLVALHGEVTFNLTEEGGDATFEVNIPNDVADEAGGIANLEALFTIAPTTPLVEVPLTFTASSSGLRALITIPNLQSEDYALSVTFSDTSVTPKEFLGSCTQSVTLDYTPTTLTCDLVLVRRAVITGNLLATLGVNVFDEDKLPVVGATVFANGDLIGITGSGAFGTRGYLRAFLLTDDYTIRAERGIDVGEGMISLPPLSIDNIDIILDQMDVGASAPGIGTEVFDSASDAFGNIYLTGRTSGSGVVQPPGASGMLIAKLDRDRNVIWARAGLNGAIGHGITVDEHGDVYATGRISDDSVIEKYDSDGNQVWSQVLQTNVTSIGGSDGNERDVFADKAGHIYFTSSSTETLGITDIDGFLFREHIVLLKLDLDGNRVWGRLLGGNGDERGATLTIDSAGDIYVGGWSFSDFDNPGHRSLLAKYNPSGNLVWTRQFGSPQGHFVKSLASDALGHVYAYGSTDSDAPGTHVGGRDVYLSKYDAAGNVVWSRQLGSAFTDDPGGVAVDQDNNPYITGFSNNAFNGLPHTNPNHSFDVFVTKFDASGTIEWEQLFGSPNDRDDRGQTVVVNSDNDIFVSGTTNGELLGLPLPAGQTIFVIKYNTDGAVTLGPILPPVISFDLMPSLLTTNSSKPRDWEHFVDSNGDTFLILGRNADPQLEMHQWDPVAEVFNLVDTQSVPGIDGSSNGVADVKHFHADGTDYFLIADLDEGRLFSWDGTAIQGPHQLYNMPHVFGWETYEIDGQLFAAGAGLDGPESLFFRWDGAPTFFTEVQNTTLQGGADFEYFMIDGVHYLAMANLRSVPSNGSDHEFDTHLLRLDGAVWNSIQFFFTDGAKDWEHFVIDGVHYFALAQFFNNTTHGLTSFIYRWDDVNNQIDVNNPVQGIPTTGAEGWEYFQIGNQHFLAVANRGQGTSGAAAAQSRIYKWNSATLQFEQFGSDIPTHTANHWEHVQIGNDHFLLNPNGGGSLNTQIFKASF